jgi:HTH-type transcriptional regulator/antitoxin HigA
MPALDQSKFNGLYPLKAILNEKDYEDALNSMEMVFDETDGDLGKYSETLTILMEYYESQHFHIPDCAGVDALKFLMEQNHLKQKDLVGVLGGKSTVSEILNKKRALTLKHVNALSAKFNVNPSTFL